MEPLEGQFHAGRKRMITAFVELSTLAARAGVDEDIITALHGDFFDGNVEIKDAFGTVTFLAWRRRASGVQRE